MKPLGIAAALLAASPAWAAYSYFFTDNLTSLNSSNWTQAGTVTVSNGMSAPDPSGGSLIYRPLVWDGVSYYDYEIRAVVALPASGGTYTLFARATSDARTGGGGSGTFYAFQMENPTWDQAHLTCSANFSFYEQMGRGMTQLNSFVHSCRNGMVMRMMVRPGAITVWADQALGYTYFYNYITTGQPGIGGYGMPAGNAITQVQIGYLDRVAPTTVESTGVAYSALPYRIEMQWKGSSDGATGSGVAFYGITRNGTWIGNALTAEFADATVSPDTSYTYTIQAIDNHYNASGLTTFTARSAPLNAFDPRRVGVRPNGSYWGAAGEQIDLNSGNLNFTVPLVQAKSRGGWGATFALNYNSQMWRQDPAGNWKLGRDVGYGFGWKLLAGSVTPYWQGLWTIDHYIYTDSTGAEYRLDHNDSGRWTSHKGIYVTFDTNASPPRLYFPDGSFWVMDVQSSGNEDDAGTLYPSIIEDTNGNQIAIHYQAGSGAGVSNSSARIVVIEDPRGRSINFNGTVYPSLTYSFTYDATPHLTSVASYIYTPESYTLSYTTGPLSSPFTSQSFGTTSLLSTLTNTDVGGTPITPPYQFQASGAGELTQATTPLGGWLQWGYRSYTYAGSRSYREVSTRTMGPGNGSSYSWTITPDSNPALHGSTTVADVGAGTQKVWTFVTDVAAFSGFASSYEERGTSGAALLHKDYAWLQDAIGNVYLSAATTTLDPGTGGAVKTKTVQTMTSNGYGNIAETDVYDYIPASRDFGAASRVYTYTYLTDSNYTSRYIRNRLASATVSPGALTLVLNCYDGGCGSGGLFSRTGQALHDDANYGSGFVYRGNPTRTTTWSGGTTYRSYETTGVVYQTMDGSGRTVNVTPAASTGYSLPGVLTPGGNNNLATNLGYDNAWAVTSVAAPNGATSSTAYDGVGRPLSSTMADGAITTYTYSYAAGANVQTATLGTRWKKTTQDGFGRTVKVETGHDSTTVSTVDTQYAPCACSPLGKLWRVSQPYAPGGTPVWTTYTYDGSGRTLTVTAPDGSVTHYVYAGNLTTVTDPAGKWRTFTNDAYGNLVTVTEPNPAGGANLATTYTYNGANQLGTVTMTRSEGTQTRTFTWSGSDLASASNPENGLVSYLYDGAHRVTQRTDAKGQQTQYSYDSYGRLTQVRHYVLVSGVLTEQLNQRVNYYYDYDYNAYAPGFAQNAWGRLAAVTFPNEASGSAEQLAYLYSYNQAGRVTTQRLRLYKSGQDVMDLDAAYAWDTEGRMTSLGYPGNGQGGGYAPQYLYQYDVNGRLGGMQEKTCTSWDGSQCYGWQTLTVAGATYGPAGEISGLTYDGYSESRTYNNLLQVTRMTVAGAMDMQYVYTGGQNNGRIGQSIDSISGETVVYTYDTLNRLARAETTSAAWGDAYTYDGFGNLTGKTPTKGNAPALSVLMDAATNRPLGGGYDANGNPPVGGPGLYPYDVENRLLLPASGFAGWTYDASGKRVLAETPRGYPNPPSTTCEIYFYGIGGQKLATYSCGYNDQDGGNGAFWYMVKNRNLYFGGKLMRSAGATVVTDRLGSVRARRNGGGWDSLNYYPYGEERTSTANGWEKFGTYFRDANGVDYAEQRYYASTSGRFLTPDPLGMDAADLSDPGSWNRYAYVDDDPVGQSDPSGLEPSPTPSSGCLVDLNGLGYWAPFCPMNIKRNAAYAPLNPTPARIDTVFNSYAKKQLKQGLANLSEHCTSVLNDAGINMGVVQSRAGTVKFYDASLTSAYSQVSIGYIAPQIKGVAGQYELGSFVGAASAKTLDGTNTVLLGDNFFGLTSQLGSITEMDAFVTNQLNTLVHEAIHATLAGATDAQLFGNSKLIDNGLDLSDWNGSGHLDTDGFTQWLDRGCTKKE